MGHKFEIFTAGCVLCKSAIEILKNTISEKSEFVEYNLQNPIQEDTQEKINKYEIKVVPSIIVDEKHKFIGIPKPEDIKKIVGI
ncbi:MAG: thioredoxin family protein [Candidatus Lokiarchaeota archaeon]|nr:thioredoxin family protein [Candidatus Lokiarchaeota archaeon]